MPRKIEHLIARAEVVSVEGEILLDRTRELLDRRDTLMRRRVELLRDFVISARSVVDTLPTPNELVM